LDDPGRRLYRAQHVGHERRQFRAGQQPGEYHHAGQNLEVNSALLHYSGRVMRKWLLFGVLALLASFASAQNYPERPIRIIVPLTPGGSPDTIARAVALGLQSVWAQPVVVENRPGGSQNIGADLVAK